MNLGVQLAQPYDAPTILEIDPVTHALETFGNVGKEPCKWYGGVLAPNDKIYAIPYASQFVMEISPESKTAAIFGFRVQSLFELTNSKPTKLALPSSPPLARGEASGPAACWRAMAGSTASLPWPRLCWRST